MLAKREFSFSQASHSVLAQYRQDCDSGATWIAENLIVGAMTEPPTHYSVIAEVYADYAEYMKMGNMRPLTSVDFGRKMGRAIAEYKARLLHKRIEGKFTRILANVTFKNVKEY
jgi:phage/plasmid-associated DNA primase